MKTKEQELTEKLAKLHEELPKRKLIFSVMEHEGIKEAIAELKSLCTKEIDTGNYNEASKKLKDLQVINGFIDFLRRQELRISEIEESIESISKELKRDQLSIFKHPELD